MELMVNIIIPSLMNSKLNLLAFASLLLARATTLAEVDLGIPAGNTPYDRYMSPVKQVLCSLRHQSTDIRRAEDLLRVGHNFRYSFTDPYTAALPSVTAQTHSGDCKAKSLWLVDQLGDANVRFVIGKARASSKISHAWVMWNDGQAWWILDPTNASRPIPAASAPRNEYIPLYSWARNGSYRHTATATGVTAVASKTHRAPASAAGRN